MNSWAVGRTTVDYLIGINKLERLLPDDAVASAAALAGRAELRLLMARAGFEVGDVEGAFVAAYDSYRMVAESLLMRQALRATGGPGSHTTVEDTISTQFSGEIRAFAKPTFERFRRARNSAQYFDPGAPEVSESDSEWAIETVTLVVADTRRLIAEGSLSIYQG